MKFKDDNYVPDDPSESKTKHGRAFFFFFQHCSDLFALPATLVFFYTGSILFTSLCLLGFFFTIYSLWRDIEAANSAGLVPCPNCGYAQHHAQACETQDLVLPKATTFTGMVKDAISYGSPSLKWGIYFLPASVVITLILWAVFTFYS